MNLEGFKAGYYRQQNQYKSFSPSKVNENWYWNNQKLNTLLAEANHKLGSLNAFSLYVPDVDFYIQMHKAKEATASSRIEGTKTEVEDALLREADVLPERRDDWQEVQNYIEAMNFVIGQLETLPISTRLLKETHRILLGKGRGEKKEPGEYRHSQNWIGGANPGNASFVPPHHEEVPALMGDLENFLHNESIDVPELVRIAIGHYQFETIHPFLDGNGRIGRLMITIYLVSKGLLTKPTLYLSDYFEKHRTEYIDQLARVREKDDILPWLRFFMEAVIATATTGADTFGKIQKLRDEVEGIRLVKLGKRFPRAKELVNALYRKPTVTAADVAEILDVVQGTANTLIDDFVKLGILIEITGSRRNRIFTFSEYVKLFTS